MSLRLQIVGGGKMGEALLGGVISSGWPAGDVAVVEPNEQRRDELIVEHPGVEVRESIAEGVDAIVAVKPQYVLEVAESLSNAQVARVLSIAAGVTIGSIEAQAPDMRVIRCMPNTPALVGEGASAVAAGPRADDDDLAWARNILSAVGQVVVVDEPDLDTVTGLSGSGPAYVFLLAEAMTAAAQRQGLAPDVADTLTRQTLLGAATLLSQSGLAPAQLRENVTSPGGTTAAGLQVFADADFAGLVDDVIDAAVKRSRELGST